VAYYTYFARLSFEAGPTHDDLMNLHRAAVAPWPTILRETLFFFLPSDQYRPVGAIFYRVIHDLAGFNAFALHFGMFLLWPLGLFCIYEFLRRVSGSRELAAFATLLNVHHSNRTFYYVNVGLIYDVLCQLFYFAAAAYYVRVREADRRPAPREMLGLSALFVLALGSKEMAVSLPVLLLTYEWLFHARGQRDYRFVVLAGGMTAAFIAGRVFGPNGLGGMASYVPAAGGVLYLEGWADWLGNLLYHRQPLTLVTTALVLLGLAVTSWLTADRTVRLGLVLALVGVLPVAFIRPMRGLEAICIPTAALAWIAAWWITRLSLVFPHPQRAPALFALLMLVLADLHVRRRLPAEAILAEGREIERVKSQLLHQLPALPRRGRVLFTEDPFPPPFRWGSLFLLQSQYGPDLQVERADQLAAAPDWSRFDYVLAWRDGRVWTLKKP